MKYKLIYDDNGQTCNRFWGYLDSVAWAILNKRKVIILHWDPNIKYYRRLMNSPYVSFPFYSVSFVKKFGDKKAQKYVYWLYDNIFFYWFFANFRSVFGIIQIVRGWNTRNNLENHQKAGKAVYDLFLPNEDIIKEVCCKFEIARKESDIIVGVHIRKGDYQEWLDGKYFFEDGTYESFMAQIEQDLAPQKVTFFISTNGDVSDVIKKKHTTLRIENGNMAHDLYGLSICDYIIGPPSTFSKWAALTGHVPLCHVYDPTKPILLDDFTYSNALARWVI